MSQRLVAALLAIPLAATLLLVATFSSLPYTTYGPGPTIDVLSAPDGKEIIQVQGQKTYRDDGQLRMTTVSISPATAHLGLFEVMARWLDRNDAVYPHDAVYPNGQTEEESKSEGQVEMVSSQDTAIAVALRALKYDVRPAIEVQGLRTGSPADGALALRDLIVGVNGTDLTGSDIPKDYDTLTAAIRSTPAGGTVSITVLRDGAEVTVPMTPETTSSTLLGVLTITGHPQVGISIGEGYAFPFPVQVNINPQIGGPSAGLMFALGIYDTLTPGSLTDGGSIAGTGEIEADGTVGPIGGIQQKIVGARSAGADLFLVPSDNCADAEGAHNGDMRLAKVTSFASALQIVQAWAADHQASLPSCGGS